MTFRLPTRLLAVLLLVAVGFSTQPAGTWYCEGQRCGISLWNCCCADPDSRQDSNCRESGASSAKTDTRLCSAPCNCVVVVTGVPNTARKASGAAPVPVPPIVAVLPAPVAPFAVPLAVKTVAYRLETRGPPARRLYHTFSALRAPPAAA